MTGDQQSSMDNLLTLVQEKRFSRAGLLKAAGLGLAAAALPVAAEARGEFPFFPGVQGTYSTEPALNIAMVLHTMAHFSTSLIYDDALTACLKESRQFAGERGTNGCKTAE